MQYVTLLPIDLCVFIDRKDGWTTEVDRVYYHQEMMHDSTQ